jgi:hypothetical protein
MKEKELIDKLRTGDVIGTAPWWHNRFYNFFKLWILLSRKYAQKYWKQIFPVRFYVICKRGSDLMYAATVKKQWGKLHLEYMSLRKIGSVVYVGRHEYFNTFQAQGKLNLDLMEIHSCLVMNGSTGGFNLIGIKFAVCVILSAEYHWNELSRLKHFKPRALDVVELGGIQRI